MIETEISIAVNRKNDIEVLKKSIIESEIKFPVFIMEYENSFHINFTSDYEEWELDSKIIKNFPDYEFTTNLENGKKEIRLQISRYQSEFSTDGWGRRIENPLNETKYLIKKSNKKTEEFNPKINVLFENTERNYYVNIVGGVNKSTGENGFLLLNEFNNEYEINEVEIFKDKLYKSPIEAFNSGYLKVQGKAIFDFAEYIENKKKEIRELHKIPRKIIRDFINSCNKSDIKEVLKNLDENLIFEKRIHWKTEFIIDGIQNFEEYINSENQELCGKNYKIRSDWNIKLPHISIDLKFYPISTENTNGNSNFQKYSQISFELANKKIINIIKEK